MPKLGTSGSVRGARGTSRPYRDPRHHARSLPCGLLLKLHVLQSYESIDHRSVCGFRNLWLKTSISSKCSDFGDDLLNPCRCRNFG